jgi:hypothetical protein
MRRPSCGGCSGPLDRLELGETLLSRCFNVLSVVHTHVYFPTFSNGLKDIGHYLGIRWTEASASGLQSIVWRRKWEQTGSPSLMHMLTTYNIEDCAALQKLTRFIYAICPAQPNENSAENTSHDGYQICRADELAIRSSRREWCKADFAIADFGFVNDRAYFDYQRDRVFIRTNKTLRTSKSRKRRKQGKKHLRVNSHIEITSTACSFCKGTELTHKADGRLVRLAYDLRMTGSGIRRWVTRFATHWHYCARCQKRFLPSDYLRLEEHFHSLRSLAMFEHIAHRTSLANVAETIRKCFGLPINTQITYGFKKEGPVTKAASKTNTNQLPASRASSRPNTVPLLEK